MRKLSKKISMLMVLAMLVSLFSGIVSASAASAWSFKSSKYDVDVKETIVMDKNEYADFDLLKEDVEVTKATYTVKWESSDEDVVWVNAKTGQLRADKFGEAEAGDKAKISATFTNVATKKSATRYFYIEIADDAEYEITVNFGDEAFVAGQKYDLAATVKADGKEVEAKVEFSIDGKAIDAAYTPAEAGEVTIVAVATIDGKEVAKSETKVVVDAAGLESAKQTAFNAVALTFGSADVAKTVAADASKLASVYFIGENEIQAFINTAKVDEKNANVVNVTLYNSISKGVTYKFTYGDKSATVVGADLSQVASMTIATTSVPGESWETVKVNLYTADGILVQTVDNGFSLKADWDGAYVVDGTRIYFHNKNANASATVTATYWMPYDDNGNKIADLTATGIINSYNPDASSISNITAWSTVGTNNWVYNNTAKLAVGETKQLYFKVTKYDRNGNWNAEPAFTGSALSFEGGTLKFVSSNEEVVVVDNTAGSYGKFYPVGAGSAQIIVYRYFDNFDATKYVMGVFNVSVVGSRVLADANPSVTNKKLSLSNSDSYTLLMPNAVDQLGSGIEGATYSFKLQNATQNVKVYVNGNEISTSDGKGTTLGLNTGTAESGNAPFVEVTADATDSNNYSRSILIGVTVEYGDKTIYKVVPISVKIANANDPRYSLDSVKGAIDMNLLTDNRWNYENLDGFKTTVKMTITDGDGYLVKVVDDELSRGAATTGNYFWVVTKNGQDASGDFNDRTLETVTSEVTQWGTKLHKKAPATYSVVIYKNNNGQKQYIASKNIVVTDSTAKITAVKVNNKVNSIVPQDLTSALDANNLKFYRNGQAIDHWACSVEFTEVNGSILLNNNTISVKKMTIGEACGKDGRYQIETTVDVYTTFEYVAP